jgi:hypothetical protein
MICSQHRSAEFSFLFRGQNFEFFYMQYTVGKVFSSPFQRYIKSPQIIEISGK